MTTPRKIPTAILISGRGTNMQALIEAAKAPDYPARIALVLSNQKDAAGLSFAKEAGIATAVVEHKAFGKDREAFENAVQDALQKHGVEFICLAGFMRVLTPAFLAKWPRRIVNIHPSLLPAFPGLDTHKRVLEAKVETHGCSVHYVSAEIDAGELIAQTRVPVLPGDTDETLAARVLEAEHKLYPRALRVILERLARTEPSHQKRA